MRPSQLILTALPDEMRSEGFKIAKDGPVRGQQRFLSPSFMFQCFIFFLKPVKHGNMVRCLSGGFWRPGMRGRAFMLATCCACVSLLRSIFQFSAKHVYAQQGHTPSRTFLNCNSFCMCSGRYEAVFLCRAKYVACAARLQAVAHAWQDVCDGNSFCACGVHCVRVGKHFSPQHNACFMRSKATGSCAYPAGHFCAVALVVRFLSPLLSAQ